MPPGGTAAPRTTPGIPFDSRYHPGYSQNGHVVMTDDAIRELLPLSTGSFHILLALADGERHGYVIAKEVESATQGSVKIGPTTLYRTIRQMVNDGWIVERARDDDDQRRRVYALTERGRAVAIAEATRLADAVAIARRRHLIPASG